VRTHSFSNGKRLIEKGLSDRWVNDVTGRRHSTQCYWDNGGQSRIYTHLAWSRGNLNGVGVQRDLDRCHRLVDGDRGHYCQRWKEEIGAQKTAVGVVVSKDQVSSDVQRPMKADSKDPGRKPAFRERDILRLKVIPEGFIVRVYQGLLKRDAVEVATVLMVYLYQVAIQESS